MAKKLSLKTFIVISLLCCLLPSCMGSVDVNVFLEDDQVKIVIEQNKDGNSTERVILAAGSDAGLVAGNGRISGLSASKYYKIEEMDGNDVVDTNFVKADGTLGALGSIGKVTGGAIKGLTNDVKYRVKSAGLYTNPTNKIITFPISSPSPQDNPFSNGTITIEEGRSDCYFNLAPTIAASKYYEVMKINVTNDTTWVRERTSAYYNRAGTTTVTIPFSTGEYTKFNTLLDIGIYEYDHAKFTNITPNFADMSIMALPATGTKNDFVFVEYYAPIPASPTDVITRDFYVLTVEVTQPVVNGDAEITITPTPSPTDLLVLTHNGSVTINSGDLITISISSGTTAEKTITPTGCDSYKWYYNNETSTFSTANIITNITSTAPFNAVGSYTITVVGTKGSTNYSKWFILKLTP